MVSQITPSETNIVSPTDISTNDRDVATAKSTGENSTFPVNIATT